MRLPSGFAAALLLCSVPALAQVLPDGGRVPCLQDADCSACGWVCSWATNLCVPASTNAGQCIQDAGCACPGQACTGSYGDGGLFGDAGAFCEAVFSLQCLCNGDCSGGQICDFLTYACHAPATTCVYSQECGCGCSCLEGSCACDGGCEGGGSAFCLSDLSDGGLVIPSLDAGVDAGMDAGGVFCQGIGGTCIVDGDCCSASCVDSSCACQQGEDPGYFTCHGDSDCCSPAVCDGNNTCYLDAGHWVPTLSDAGDGETSSSGSKNPFSCASGAGSGPGAAGLLAVILVAALSLRRKASKR